MSLVTVRISGFLDGLNIIDRQLKGIEDRASDVSPAYPAVERVFQSIVAETFQSEGASSAAGAWKPLARSTIADRRRQGFSPEHPILVRRGDMKASLVRRTSDTIIVATPTYFAIGSADEKIKFHQSRAPRKKIPRRPVFEPTQDDKHALIRPLRRFVTGHDADAPVVGRVTR